MTAVITGILFYKICLSWGIAECVFVYVYVLYVCACVRANSCACTHQCVSLQQA